MKHPINHKDGLLDARYTVIVEYNGYKTPRHTVRFCDDYISHHATETAAIRACKAYHKKRVKFMHRLPLRDDIESITYHRPPTRAELKRGYGATHYRDFEPDECCEFFEGNYYLKKWFKADDGLRYYR